MITQFHIIVLLSLFIITILLVQYIKGLSDTYKKYMILESDQTHPRWRYARPFIFGVIIGLIGIGLIIFLENQSSYPFYHELFFGMLVGILITPIALSIKVALYYKYLKNNPSQISGSLTLRPGATRQGKLTSYIEILVPLIPIMLAIPHPFIYGMALGVVGLIIGVGCNVV